MMIAEFCPFLEESITKYETTTKVSIEELIKIVEVFIKAWKKFDRCRSSFKKVARYDVKVIDVWRAEVYATYSRMLHAWKICHGELDKYKIEWLMFQIKLRRDGRYLYYVGDYVERFAHDLLSRKDILGTYECSVCYSTYTGKLTSCGHVCCAPCLMRIRASGRTKCPLCRADLDFVDLDAFLESLIPSIQ